MAQIQIIDNLSSTSTTEGLSANQGRVLNSKVGDLNSLQTINKTNSVLAINEIQTALTNLLTMLDNINGEVI